MELILQLTFLFGFLLGTYLIGSVIESRHFKNIEQREQALSYLMVSNLTRLPETKIHSSTLVQGNIVISLDYFKRFIAGLRMLFGGRVAAYEPLLDRARREAMLRMRQQAQELGYDLVINFRMETSRLANDNEGHNSNTAGVEILAYGTAVKFEQSHDSVHPPTA